MSLPKILFGKKREFADESLILGPGRRERVLNQDLNLVSNVLAKTELHLSVFLLNVFHELIQCVVTHVAICPFIFLLTFKHAPRNSLIAPAALRNYTVKQISFLREASS